MTVFRQDFWITSDKASCYLSFFYNFSKWFSSFYSFTMASPFILGIHLKENPSSWKNWDYIVIFGATIIGNLSSGQNAKGMKVSGLTSFDKISNYS